MKTFDNDPRLSAPPILTLTELRVLSGLSRGAAMPLEDQITIGSDFACDLILVDPDVAERHATLQALGNGRYTLSMVDAPRTSPTNVGLGEQFEVAGIRMVLAPSDAPWDFALPVTKPVPLSDIEQAVASAVAAGRLGPGAASKGTAPTSSRPRWIVAAACGVVALVLVGFGVFLLLEPDPPPLPKPVVAAPRLYSEADVQLIAKQFGAHLEELNILGVKLGTAPQQLAVQGLVDKGAESRFEAAVQQLRDSHPGLKVRLDLDTDSAAVLPFEVTAAVGGPNGSVLLSDGQQLFVGAEEQGFRFLGLAGACLNFIHVATQQKVSQCADQKTRRR